MFGYDYTEKSILLCWNVEENIAPYRFQSYAKSCPHKDHWKFLTIWATTNYFVQKWCHYHHQFLPLRSLNNEDANQI